MTIKELHAELKEKKISSLELTKDTLEKIEKNNSKISAFLANAAEVALEQAKKADSLIASEKEVCWLTGIPFGLKDWKVLSHLTARLFMKICSPSREFWLGNLIATNLQWEPRQRTLLT